MLPRGNASLEQFLLKRPRPLYAPPGHDERCAVPRFFTVLVLLISALGGCGPSVSGRGPRVDGTKGASPKETRDCSADAAACEDAAMTAFVAATRWKDFVAAANLFDNACEAGRMDACTHLAELLEDGLGVAPDDARAAVLFERACTAGKPIACDRLGRHVYVVEGLPQAARAASLFAMACKGGEPLGCVHLAECRARGQGVEKDLGTAAATFVEHCARLSDGSCGSFGGLVLQGDDLERAKKLTTPYVAACAKGEALGCARVAYMHDRGIVLAGDVKLAFKHYDLACNGGLATACAQSGWMLINGEGVPKDTVKGTARTFAACDAGSDEACRQSAIELTAGEHVPRDLERAGALFLKACKLGSRRTLCHARTLMGGVLTDRGGEDRTLGSKLIDAECAEGDVIACALKKKLSQ